MRFFTTLLAGFLGTLAALFFIAVIGFFFIVALIASAGDSTPQVRDGSVLVLDLGAVPELAADDPFAELLLDESPVDLRMVKRALRNAATDDRIRAVWLDPVGVQADWAQLEEIRAALLTFKQSGKPLVAYGDGEGFTEPAYFLATAADSIYTAPEASFEFNGFALIPEFYKDLLDNLDVDVQIVRAGTFKAAGESFSRTDLSPENEQQLRELLGWQTQTFLQAVSENRNQTPEQIQALMSADLLYSADEAHQAGLLDDLMYRDQLERRLLERFGEDPDGDFRTISLSDYARTGQERSRGETIAVVYAEGMILSGKSESLPFGDAVLGAATFIEAMAEAREDDDVRAVVIRVNSPGGSATASDAMWHAVRETAAEKPVIVSMGGVAASGGYYIAAPADTIVADPLTITGSIGVIYQLLDVSGFFNEKIGVTFDPLTSAPYADAFSGLRELTPTELQLLQRDVDATYATFVSRVAEGRGLTPERVREIGGGRVYSGAEAQQIGLVDVLGGLDTAMAIAAEKAGLSEATYRVRVLPRPKSLFESLLGTTSAQVAGVWQRWSLSPAERALLSQARLLHTLHTQQGMRMEMPFRLETR